MIDKHGHRCDGGMFRYAKIKNQQQASAWRTCVFWFDPFGRDRVSADGIVGQSLGRWSNVARGQQNTCM